jgi:tRNA(Arg) A34 adenosine deaminase TadA
VWTLSKQEWQSLWSNAFAEAWHSYCSGGWGVGALLISNGGSIECAARNTARGDSAQSTSLHAEMGALQGMPNGHGPFYRIVCTLEPCIGCLGALTFQRLQSVYFAARDLSFSAGWKAIGDSPFIGPRMPAPIGPRFDTYGVVCRALALCAELDNGCSRGRWGLERRLQPAIVRISVRLVEGSVLRRLRGAQASPTAAFETIATYVTDESLRNLATCEATLRRLGVVAGPTVSVPGVE